MIAESRTRAYLASIVPMIVNTVLNEHQLVLDIVAFVSKGDFPRSRLGEKQRGKILASWVSRKMQTIAQFSIRDPEGEGSVDTAIAENAIIARRSSGQSGKAELARNSPGSVTRASTMAKSSLNHVESASQLPDPADFSAHTGDSTMVGEEYDENNGGDRGARSFSYTPHDLYEPDRLQPPDADRLPSINHEHHHTGYSIEHGGLPDDELGLDGGLIVPDRNEATPTQEHMPPHRTPLHVHTSSMGSANAASLEYSPVDLNAFSSSPRMSLEQPPVTDASAVRSGMGPTHAPEPLRLYEPQRSVSPEPNISYPPARGGGLRVANMGDSADSSDEEEAGLPPPPPPPHGGLYKPDYHRAHPGAQQLYAPPLARPGELGEDDWGNSVLGEVARRSNGSSGPGGRAY